MKIVLAFILMGTYLWSLTSTIVDIYKETLEGAGKE